MKAIKHLGQNFLKDKRAITKLIKAANLTDKDVVLEIGPGTGILTKEIVQKVKKVIAVEKDIRMIKLLKEKFKELKNIEIVQKDILKFKPPTGKYKIIASLPFYIATPIIKKFLEEKNQPEQMTLIIQKEVAQRICAQPPKTNILAVSVQYYAQPKIISYISKRSFTPVPKVNSAIIQITPEKKYQRNDQFFKVVKAGFSHPRKQLINNLSKELNINKEKIKNILLKNNIQPTQRAETLSIQDWITLSSLY